jgi:DNA-binding SARP family transcriptional activator
VGTPISSAGRMDRAFAQRDAGRVRGCLRLLGPIGIDGPHGRVCPAGPIQRRLLAALGVQAGRVVGESRLVDALWDEAPPRTAAKTLQNHVLRLRRSLAGLDGVRIVTRAPGYMLEVPGTDTAAAAGLVARAGRATREGDHDLAVEAYEEALALWSGPALAEFATRPFARAEAVRLDELRRAVTEDRVDALLAGGRHHEAVGACETLVSEEPLRERRWTQLMTALYRDGRQGEALAAYRRLRDVLTDQLGVDPGPEARALETSILVQAPDLHRPAPAL